MSGVTGTIGWIGSWPLSRGQLGCSPDRPGAPRALGRAELSDDEMAPHGHRAGPGENVAGKAGAERTEARIHGGTPAFSDR